MAAHLPRDSAVMLAVAPQREVELWDASAYLLAHIADLLAAGNWQRGGGRGSRPRPLTRPSAEGDIEPVTAADIDDFRTWYSEQPGGRRLD